MKIYTRRGDSGTTGLYRGASINKDAARVAALGDVDELNSVLGWVLAQQPAEGLARILRGVQDDLFHVGAELASLDPHSAGTAQIDDQDVSRLEGQIDELETQLPPLQSFILPGGGVCGAALHLARATARRAERAVVRLTLEAASGEAGDEKAIRPELMAYLNRLNDLLFVMARSQNQIDGIPESNWSSADRLERVKSSENR